MITNPYCHCEGERHNPNISTPTQIPPKQSYLNKMNQNKSAQLREEQGRLFEVGFNSGILAYFQQNQIQTPWLNFYQQDLAKLQFSPIVKALIKRSNSISTTNQKIITRLSELTLLRGFLGGLNFMGEYCQAQGWKKLKQVEILYFQCSFCNENSLGTHEKGDDSLSEEIIEQFRDIVKNLGKNLLDVDIERYSNKGEFLKADTLILCRYKLCRNKEDYRLLVIDTSIYSVDASQDLANSEFIELIKGKLIREINYTSSKGIFDRLNIDTGEDKDLSYAFAAEMKDYFGAFQSENDNKESLKLIQAGSYGYSFYKFLLKQKIIEAETKITISAIGYSDRGISSLIVTPQNIKILETCHEIYRENYSEEKAQESRKKILNLIKLQVYKSFDGGKSFVNQLLKVAPKENISLTHQEKLTDFVNTADIIPADLATSLNLESSLSLRDAHAQLIKQSLESNATYLFLTGNPGIGKTTAVVDFLKTHLKEGFLFFYISPRIQVNQDIIDKFKQGDKLCDDRIFCLTSNSMIISDSADNYQYIVKHLANNYPDELSRKAVKFISMTKEDIPDSSRQRNIKRENEDTIKSVNKHRPGVLASISKAIYALINTETSNQIVATASLQSLRQTPGGNNTIKHLDLILESAYKSSQNSVIPQELRKISQRIKHLFIMIDEITGSETGVEFLEGVRKFCQKYQLDNPTHGFNTKIIVADASIVEESVIEQHLGNILPEPDKVFFRQATSQPQALTRKSIYFQNKPAIFINANSYPAKSLDLIYKVFIEAQEFEPEKNTITKQTDKLLSSLESAILGEINSLWEKDGQILLYIQDKQKLQIILEKLNKKREKPLVKNEDYLEVRSNLSEVEKAEIHKYKNDPNIKLIFMTSAGSRGLSFPYVKHILVEIPGFQVEQNLMEILQVVYRGRGKEEIDKQDKQIIFYLAEKAIYYPDSDSALALQEILINILNTLLLIKVALMTRINGSGKLGNQQIVLIPIGGKSTNSAGETFSSKINNLLELLAQEYRLNPNQKFLEDIRQELQRLLSQANFSLSSSKDANVISYLASMRGFSKQFSAAINDNFAQLLNFGNLEKSYLVGGIVIVPIEGRNLAKEYYLKLAQILKLKSTKLLNNLLVIKSHREQYNQNLYYATRDALDLIDEIKTEDNNSLKLLEDNSKSFKQFYAFPLFTLLNTEILAEYLKTEEDEESSFRRILQYYLKSIYRVYDIFPIGYQYQDFPFILFRSYTLEEMRQQSLTKHYLFNSSKLNIVNLILSQQTK